MAITGASRKQAGLYYDKGGGVLNLLHPDFGTTTGTGGDDTAALVDAVAATDALGDGAKLIIPPPPVGTSYNFNDQIAPTKAIIIEGGTAGPNNAGNHQGPTLVWTGGAEAGILLSGVGCANAQLRGLSFDNTGTGTAAVQIETGRVKLRDVGIVAPTVPFSAYGISVGLNGGTTPGCELDNVTLRQAAPINLKLARIGGFLMVKGGALMDPSAGGVMSVQAGDVSSALRADYIHFIGTTFESTTTDLANVQVLRVTELTFNFCYFEISGANGVAVDIPSTAGKAQGVYLYKCRLGAITGSPYAVRSDFASALLEIDTCEFEGTYTGIFDNRNVRHASIKNNLFNGTNPVWTNNRNHVTLFQNKQTGSGAPNAAVRDDGYFIEKEKSDTTSTANVGAGETDLISYSLPASRIYENGMTIEITAWGQTAANANGKQLKLYIGGTVVLDSTSIASNNKDWFLKATLIRTTTSGGLVLAEGQINGAEIQSKHSGITVASTGWDAAQIIKVTGTGTSNADITQKGLLVKVSN